MKNESAFPKMRGTETSSFQYREFTPLGGLTKREFMAAIIAGGVSANTHFTESGVRSKLGPDEIDKVLAAGVVRTVDALIAELERKEE